VATPVGRAGRLLAGAALSSTSASILRTTQICRSPAFPSPSLCLCLLPRPLLLAARRPARRRPRRSAPVLLAFAFASPPGSPRSLRGPRPSFSRTTPSSAGVPPPSHRRDRVFLWARSPLATLWRWASASARTSPGIRALSLDASSALPTPSAGSSMVTSAITPHPRMRSASTAPSSAANLRQRQSLPRLRPTTSRSATPSHATSLRRRSAAIRRRSRLAPPPFRAPRISASSLAPSPRAPTRALRRRIARAADVTHARLT